MDHDHHDHDGGLAIDLPRMMERRRALQLLAGVGLVALVGCGSGDDTASTSTTSTANATGTSARTDSGGDCAPIPTETAGPFPGDGSNGPDALSESGVVRRDITSSFGSSDTVAEGVPLTVNLRVADTAKDCAAMAGAAVYVWHCDREGRYSMYSDGVTNENYLRGVQETDADGRATFASIFPAAYPGRWPHIHFEVYASLDDATGGGEPVLISQLALPEATCTRVYATDGYEQSVSNMARTSLDRDMVFADGSTQQVATASGTAEAGITVELTVPV